MRYKAPILIFLIGLIILSFWFYIKLVVFGICGYTSDLFSHLQISKSWLEGRPLLFENAYGYHDKIHNYYFTPFLGLFTYFLGAYGLFAAQFVIMMAGIYIFVQLYAKAPAGVEKKLLLILLLAFYLGPSAFLICDDPDYGFHTELLYFPLSICLAAGLISGKKWAFIIPAVFTILVKEDGVVLVTCIHLGWLFLNKNKLNGKFWKKAARITVLWLAVFAAGLFLLMYKNGFGNSHLAISLENVLRLKQDSWNIYFWPILRDFFISLVPVILFLLLFIKWDKISGFLLLLLPLLVVQVYASINYYSCTVFALIWAPRFALLWGYAVAFILMAVLSGNINYRFGIKFHFAGILVISALLYSLQIEGVKDYIHDYKRCTIGKEAFDNDADVQRVKKVILQFPRSYDVAIQNNYFALFPYNNIVWPDRFDSRWKDPEIILVDIDTAEVLMEKFVSPYTRYNIGRFRFFIKPGVSFNLHYKNG